MTDYRRDPTPRFLEAQETVRRMFAEMVHQPWGGHEATPPSTWQPCCDMVETDDAIIVEIELPGMRREDVTVEVHGDRLRVAGERRLRTERQGRNFHFVERHFGRFERQIPLPYTVDRSAIRADFSDGVLTVTLPKLSLQPEDTNRERTPHGPR
jgi:HSP20 family protein